MILRYKNTTLGLNNEGAPEVTVSFHTPSFQLLLGMTELNNLLSDLQNANINSASVEIAELETQVADLEAKVNQKKDRINQLKTL